MGKVESKKIQKFNTLLETAFHLFTTKGVNKTSIDEISKQAGVAKGTFYLYFKDKYDIRNKLISHEASKLFKEAAASLNNHTVESLEEKIIFIADHIIDALNDNKILLTFISKNLSWGVFKEALTHHVADNDINFKDVYYAMLKEEKHEINEPEIMLFLITELVGSTCYSAILDEEPANIATIKPYLFATIRSIIRHHTGELKNEMD